MSSIAATASTAVWEQVRLVRSRLGGVSWHQAFTGPVPLPVWLVDVVDGHMDAYVGPDPVLFRTAGIAAEWFAAAAAHPGRLEVTCPHGQTAPATLRAVSARLADAGAQVDADVYLWGDGDPDGVFSARMHALYGVFPSHASMGFVVTQMRGFSDLFHLRFVPGREGITVTVTPQLRGVGGV